MTAERMEVPIQGMDCAECVVHVREAIASVPGIRGVEVYLAAEKAVFELDPAAASLDDVRRVVAGAGYSVPELPADGQRATAGSRPLGILFAALVLFVLAAAVLGETLGVFDALNDRLPWAFWLALLLAAGYPVLKNVLLATWRRQIIAHTLMTVGAIAAVAVGEWATAFLVVIFMRVGDYVERLTTDSARRAVRDLIQMAPDTARVIRDNQEIELPMADVRPDDVVVVRPGERIPVDGRVLDGQATVEQAAITGESLPVEAGPGSLVYAATVAQFGSLRIRATHVGPDSTFGRVVRMVEQAESQRARVQRVADRFAGYYLPIVAGIALLTFVIGRDPLATAAVLVVACSCSFALATPIAMLASIGAAARRGLLIKGGRYLEALANADVLLIDKTGTLTLGRPKITGVMPGDGWAERDLIALAASAEYYSEHPLGRAVREMAAERDIAFGPPESFEARPGVGVTAMVGGLTVEVGNDRLAAGRPGNGATQLFSSPGESRIHVIAGGRPAGLLTASDRERAEVPAAMQALREMGVRHILLLTGDNEETAAAIARPLGITYRANLLPEEKFEIVRDWQARGHRVVMVGDGVNDAPALAQADVGIAMGVLGSDIAVEAAHVALMVDDWALVPEIYRIARRTMGVVRLNIGLTSVYNLIGLTLAAFGLLPPVIAAAAQSIPDIGILLNSSRLLRQE
jgi:Cd2+/Zn2+-exporting ATPase/Cu+-exporting ATPase